MSSLLSEFSEFSTSSESKPDESPETTELLSELVFFDDAKLSTPYVYLLRGFSKAEEALTLPFSSLSISIMPLS